MASSGEPCFKISALEPLKGEGEGNEGLILIVFILHCALMSCFAIWQRSKLNQCYIQFCT